MGEGRCTQRGEGRCILNEAHQGSDVLPALTLVGSEDPVHVVFLAQGSAFSKRQKQHSGLLIPPPHRQEKDTDASPFALSVRLLGEDGQRAAPGKPHPDVLDLPWRWASLLWSPTCVANAPRARRRCACWRAAHSGVAGGGPVRRCPQRRHERGGRAQGHARRRPRLLPTAVMRLSLLHLLPPLLLRAVVAVKDGGRRQATAGSSTRRGARRQHSVGCTAPGGAPSRTRPTSTPRCGWWWRRRWHAPAVP